MRVFILGGAEGNAGPTNVNKELMRAWPALDTVRTNNGSGLMRLFNGLAGVLWAECVVSSGGGRTTATSLFLARALRKPYLTIAHGFPPFENEVNGLGYSRLNMRIYLSNLRHSRLVVGVSRKQAEFVELRVPDLYGKVRHFTNGIAKRDALVNRDAAISPSRKKSLSIAVSGGTRPVKNNHTVLKAVEKLNDEGFPCELRVYGRSYAGKGLDFLEAVEASPHARMMGQVAPEEFLASLSESGVFVQDSLHEPFGLSAIDALQAGCSLLISAECGVCEVLDLDPSDVMDEPRSVDEVAAKIKYLAAHPNASRIMSTIDFEKHSWEAAALRLRSFCLEALGGGKADESDAGKIGTHE